MNKTELCAAIAAKTGLAKNDADKFTAAFVESVIEGRKAGEKIQIVGFGTFSVKERAARTGKNPSTGETIQIAACKVPAFAAGKALKDEIQ